MRSTARQLLLEILLLRERYSTDDFRRVSDHISNAGRDSGFDDISELLYSFPASVGKRKVDSDVSSVDPVTAKERFLAGLGNRRSAAATKRMKTILKRLGISESERARAFNHDQMIAQIRKSVDRMSEEELVTFLKPYRAKVSADEGYLGLANYIMHKGE